MMMPTTESEQADCEVDSRIPCKYGVQCYQKNLAHLNKYKHPPKSAKRQCGMQPGPSKKLKVDKGSSLNKISLDNKNRISNENKETNEEKGEVSNSSKTMQINNEETIIKNKQEKISPSASEDESEYENEENTTVKTFDPKLFIKAKFLVTMPNDFYDFWESCKELKPTNPCDAFKDVGLKLVGAYDVLAGNFKHRKKSSKEYLRHWRYYYDPPEVQTVLKGDDSTGYHIAYFYDSPDEPPSFLVSNHGMKDEELEKIGDPFKKMHVRRLLAYIKSKAEKFKFNMSSQSLKIKERESKVVAKTFNKVGLVVPYNKKTQLGYRELAISDKELMTLLNKLEMASPEQKAKYLSDLQPVLTYANIAIDECDFGTGVKLGWELLYHGIDSLNSTILQFLSNSYKYLNREAFTKIAEAHLSQRKKGCDLSIL
ncbi:UPF0609 protein C4orf27 [Asbolus verrucosus]|uniref:UPF0609 protein C4orf27 n=1 Tax=Asbolus verrucosus TaxID=1661398 RepID=A0A482VA96_ASBVE|nr:UPF0609 protein C4orf27 [Asbolus verrucosus]